MKVEKCLDNENKEDIPFSFLFRLIVKGHKHYLDYFLNNKEELDYEFSPNNKKITKGEYPFIMELYEKEGLTQQDLAEMFHVSQANVARVIRHLEDIDIIKREVDDSNRRKKIVTLTEEGNKACVNVINLENKWEEDILKNLSKDDQEKLKDLLYELSLNTLDIFKEY